MRASWERGEIHVRYQPVPHALPGLQSRLMSDSFVQSDIPLCAKIARLVRERGWNRDEFARFADLNRLTIRAIFQDQSRKLHNATVSACARALGVSVHDLLTQPVEKLLPRMRL